MVSACHIGFFKLLVKFRGKGLFPGAWHFAGEMCRGSDVEKLLRSILPALGQRLLYFPWPCGPERLFPGMRCWVHCCDSAWGREGLAVREEMGPHLSWHSKSSLHYQDQKTQFKLASVKKNLWIRITKGIGQYYIQTWLVLRTEMRLWEFCLLPHLNSVFLFAFIPRLVLLT